MAEVGNGSAAGTAAHIPGYGRELPKRPGRDWGLRAGAVRRSIYCFNALAKLLRPGLLAHRSENSIAPGQCALSSLAVDAWSWASNSVELRPSRGRISASGVREAE